MGIVILLPVYNEEGNIEKLVDRIYKVFSDKQFSGFVLIVDDGSNDKTKEILTEIKKKYMEMVRILSHDRNLGLGGALKTGFMYLKNVISGDDFVVVMDADNTHPPEVIPSVVEKMMKDNIEVMILSRYIKGSREYGVPLLRRVGSRIINFVLRHINRTPNIYDYTSGYRIYSGGIVKRWLSFFGDECIVERSFASTVEVLMKLLLFNPKVGSYPLELKYSNKKGKSKMRIFSTLFAYLKIFFHIKRVKFCK
jgi:dolichol-phosphate mannosyltransferase